MKEPDRVSKTCEIAQTIFSDRPLAYLAHARQCLPILIRQAKANQPITYNALAKELGMPFALNLNFVLGSIGKTLLQLSKEWGHEIPAIQTLVVEKGMGLPGKGLWSLLSPRQEFKKLTRRQKRELMEAECLKAYLYPEWGRVLDACGLLPLDPSLIEEDAEPPTPKMGGSGEGEAHLKLKEFIASHPEALKPIVQVPSRLRGETESDLPSGDSVDVVFRWSKNIIAVEVKSSRSDEADLRRGLFQCVKYQAVLDAWMRAQERPDDVQTVLVLEGLLPKCLSPLQHVLGIEVLEGVRVPADSAAVQ